MYIRQRQTPIVNDVIFSCLVAGEDFINAWKYIMKHKILDYVDYFETFLRNHADSDRGLYSSSHFLVWKLQLYTMNQQHFNDY